MSREEIAETGDNALAIGFQIKIASSGAVFTVANDKTIVQVLAEHGIDIATSCTAGLCGSCKVRYLAGEVDHRDLVLSHDARAEYLTVCVSRAKSPLLVLDLAVPRDVDPAVGRIPDVFLYDLDALGAVVAENQALRRAQEQVAEDILAAEIDVTLRQMAVAGLNAVITELRQGSRGIVEGELTWALDRLPDLDERSREILRQMADRIGNKLIDGPIRSAKREVFQQGQDGEVGSWLARLFRW